MKTNIFALPGFSCTGQMYAPLFSSLKIPTFNLSVFDNWGFGTSNVFGKHNYSLQDLASYHWSIIAEKNLNPNKDIVLMGTSMGGFLAQEMCMQKPDEVGALIFLCTLGPTKNGFIPPVALTEEGLRTFHGLPKEQKAFFATEGTVHPTLKVKEPAVYQSIYQYRLNNECAIEEQVEQNKAAVNFLDGEIDFEKISSIPALCLQGENDRFVNPLNAGILSKKFALSKKVLISESDHFFFMEKPDAVALEIQNFLSELKK